MRSRGTKPPGPPSSATNSKSHRTRLEKMRLKYCIPYDIQHWWWTVTKREGASQIILVNFTTKTYSFLYITQVFSGSCPILSSFSSNYNLGFTFPFRFVSGHATPAPTGRATGNTHHLYPALWKLRKATGSPQIKMPGEKMASLKELRLPHENWELTGWIIRFFTQNINKITNLNQIL